MFGLGVTELVVILLIVALLFGTKKLKSMGTDIGGAIKGFRSAVSTEDNPAVTDSKVLEGEVGTQKDNTESRV